MFGVVQVCSDLFRVFWGDWAGVPIWSRRLAMFGVVQVCSGLFRVLGGGLAGVPVWLERWAMFGVVQVCSGLFRVFGDGLAGAADPDGRLRDAEWIGAGDAHDAQRVVRVIGHCAALLFFCGDRVARLERFGGAMGLLRGGVGRLVVLAIAGLPPPT